MKRGFVIGALAVLAFGVILVARLPASWIVPSPPSRIACTSVDGSLWNGVCIGLVYQGKTLGDARWVLHPLKLLSGRVAAHVVLNRGSGTTQPTSVQGDVEVGFSGKNITARDVKADVPLDDELRSALNINYLGTIHADLKSVRATDTTLQEIQGVIEAHDLREPRGANFGGYSLTFPGGSGEQVGQLHDLGGGALSVQGTVKITNPPGIVVQGLVAAGPQAPQSLQDDLRVLGSPDAQGRRMFSFETTF
ncbi:MAG TPA: type II secretion system protein N [Steroidobacteraceae bacterium]|jgi:general secretion pathway protein N